MTAYDPDIPRATVRLQLKPPFDLYAAAGIVPYLASLGVSHIYASPLTMSRPGSDHGYDVIDHTRVNPELGGERGLEVLHQALRSHAMGLILDFVPNHMGVGGADNGYWLDVLEWGRDSAYAHWFDIDWDPAEPTLRRKLLVPFLGMDYGATLTAGELRLDFNASAGTFAVWYHEHCFPISPREYPRLLREAPSGSPLHELAERFAGLAHRRRASQADKEAAGELKRALAALAAADPRAHGDLQAIPDAYTGEPGQVRGFMGLHRLLERQPYRLAYWRTAADEINYRRFFDINDLAGLRVEDRDVFERLHTLALRLIETGRITGIRLDHVDGLYDPRAYLARLRGDAEQRVQAGDNQRDPYILVEKILAPFEELPADWEVQGTTGYDFMAQALRVLLDPAAERPLTRLYTRLTAEPGDFETVVVASKHQILRHNLAAEFNVIARRLARLAKRHWQTRDFTHQAIRAALADILARFPVYRSYIADGPPAPADRERIVTATRHALRAPGLVDESVYYFIRDVLLTEWRPRQWDRAAPREVRRIARKAQQLTGPVTAKAVEDTAFYRYARFIAANEVGNDPGCWALSPEAFHAAMHARTRGYPHSLLATATHDHKRGEDARARLAVLSELPRAWARAVSQFVRANLRHRVPLSDDEHAPEANTEYFYYQSLIGAWPLGLQADDIEGLAALTERMVVYMQKAAREAKRYTNWAKPDASYEDALTSFVRASLDPERSGDFLRAVAAFVGRIAPAGAVNALAQTVLRCTCPGVPDLYQGTELWDFSLVDPDNRHDVDFAKRKTALAELPNASPAELATHWHDGRIKLAVIARLLAFRRQKPDLFRHGDYAPLTAQGPAAEHVLAFERRHGSDRLVIAVPRLSATAARGDPALALNGELWRDTRLTVAMAGLEPLFAHRNTEDGRLDELFSRFPVVALAGAG